MSTKPTRCWRYRLTAGVCTAYLAGLILILLALRFVGEQWWLTTILLYVPRLVFALPAVPLLLLTLIWKRWLLVASQISALVLATSLSGFHLAWPRDPAAGTFTLRIAVCNMATGTFAVEGIVDSLRASHADVILLQEAHESLHQRLTAAATGYSVSGNGQFWVASRFPILQVYEPGKLRFAGQMRSPRFVRYRLSTPRGNILVYNVHFISPRDGLEELRGEGFGVELRRGNLFSSKSRAVIDNNTALRELQMRTVREDAARSAEPAIIAGDTNLPDLSWALSHWFGEYRDAFSEAGRGFGYTFPAPIHPWMRIDRILADQEFEFSRAMVVNKALSDHFPVIAQISWPKGG